MGHMRSIQQVLAYYTRGNIMLIYYLYRIYSSNKEFYLCIIHV